jgi:flagellar basal-body rod protein FlgG
MIRSMWAAASGMQAQSMNIDVIANNLANVTTSGFKRSRAEFQDLLYETLQPPGGSTSENTQVPTGIQLGHGVRPVTVAKNFTEGELQLTKNELDLAIEGNGFFQVSLPNGTTAYTRAGAFKLDKDGRIVTPDGFLLSPEISIPTDSISLSVGLDGTVSALQAGESAPRQLGTIQLARFTNPAGLQSMGKNLFLPTDASGTAIVGTAGEQTFGTISQGFLEMSNVSIVDEMVNMITAQRAYETNSKVVQASDDMLQAANNLKR